MNEIKPILQAIRAQYALSWDGLHGITHWARVYENGLLVAKHTLVGQDLILLFAVFHDACRRNDGLDPDHGRRGADLAAAMRGQHFDLPDDQFELLYQACAHHTDGLVQGEAALLTCWDADRLDLPRAGITPTPRRLCTTAAKDPGVISWARERSLREHVPELVGTEWGQELHR
jgi:uncharacterized protein